MNSLSELLQELGISKVRLAKYLNVSRQMVYNYLELEDLNKWPKEKKILLLKLLDIEDGDEGTIKGIKITTDYLMSVENRLNQGVKSSSDMDSFFDMKGLNKSEQTLIADITYLIKEKLFEGILYSALTLYNNGGASRSNLAESHKRFVQEIEQKNEEKLSRTQQLNTIKIQALRELGYNQINEQNAAEVFEKIAEIQSRKV